jgi:MFS family permease
MPFLVIYFAQITGTYVLAMTVLAVETITSALMDIPTGVFSDRIGRKHTMIIGSIATTLSISCYALANNFTWLVVGAALSGLGQCLFSGNNNALLYESLKSYGKEDQFHHYQGRTKSMFQLALGLSAFCSSLFTAHGLRFLFILGIVPQILSIFVSLFFKEPRLHVATHQDGLAHLKAACLLAYRNPPLRLLILGQALSYGAGESSFFLKAAFVNIFWPTWAVGIYRGFNHFFGFISFWFAGYVLDRAKGLRLLIIAEAYWFVSQSIAVLIRNIFSPIIFLTVPFFLGSFMVARDHLLQKEFTDEQRAAMGSVASFAGSIVYGVAAICTGFLSDSFGLAAGVGFGIFAAACSLPIYLRLFRKHSVVAAG